MGLQRFTPENIPELRRRLYSDAERARSESSGECRREWVDPQLWSRYMGKAGMKLYASFSDEELLNILRIAADELGHVPSQREIFCVYRSYICRRFTNWRCGLRA